MNESDAASLIGDEVYVYRGNDETDQRVARRRSDGEAGAPGLLFLFT